VLSNSYKGFGLPDSHSKKGVCALASDIAESEADATGVQNPGAADAELIGVDRGMAPYRRSATGTRNDRDVASNRSRTRRGSQLMRSALN
jgi:hypothetical protein